MKRLVLWNLLIFVFFAIVFFLVRSRTGYRCFRDPVVAEILSYRPERYSELRVPEVKLVFGGAFFRAESPEVSVVDALKKIKVSVILGKKEYLLIGSFFVEKGKELNGIKFLGVEDGKVVLEINGKRYYKAF